MSKTETIKMERHGSEFKFRTNTFPSGKVTYDICKVVNGVDSHIKDVTNFREAHEYLETLVKKDWDRFTLFADALHDEVREVYHLFDFEPYNTVEVSRNIYLDYNGQEIIVRLTMDITAIDWITNVELTDIEIFDTAVNELCEMFVEDLWKITTQAFIYELV